jgi:hypothetical protein
MTRLFADAGLRKNFLIAKDVPVLFIYSPRFSVVSHPVAAETFP